MKLKGSQIIEVYKPSLAKNGIGAWGFNKEESNSQKGKKSKSLVTNICFVEQISLSDEKVITGNTGMPGRGKKLFLSLLGLDCL